MTPPSKTSTPPPARPVFSSDKCRSRAPNRAFFALVFDVPLPVTAPSVMRNRSPRKKVGASTYSSSGPAMKTCLTTRSRRRIMKVITAHEDCTLAHGYAAPREAGGVREELAMGISGAGQAEQATRQRWPPPAPRLRRLLRCHPAGWQSGRGALSTSATVGRGDRGEAATPRDPARPRNGHAARTANAIPTNEAPADQVCPSA